MRTLITLGLLAVLISAAAALEQPGLLRADAAAALGAGELSGGRKHNDEQDKRPNIIIILTGGHCRGCGRLQMLQSPA